MTPSYDKAAVVGSGSWGSALAEILAYHFKEIILLARSKKTVEEINTYHTNNAYLKGAKLSEKIIATTNKADLKGANILLFVVPTSSMRETAESIKEIGLSQETILVTCSKGIERGSGLRMSEIIAEVFPANPIAVHSGPTHAEEIIKNLASCAVIASKDQAALLYLQKAFSTPSFRTYTSDDFIGVELGGALKNVFAIAAGLCRGLELGDNAIAALATRGLTEMTRLGVVLGGQSQTFNGLSGLGDLMVTCYSQHSRNNRVGYAIGQGATCQEACEQLGMVAEGVPNTLSIYEAAKSHQVDTPIIDEVYKVLYKNKPVKQALLELLGRDLRAEVE